MHLITERDNQQGEKFCVNLEQRQSLHSKDHTMEILLVFTSHDRLGDSGEKTGWLEEFATSYYVLKDAKA